MDMKLEYCLVLRCTNGSVLKSHFFLEDESAPSFRSRLFSLCSSVESMRGAVWLQ